MRFSKPISGYFIMKLTIQWTVIINCDFIIFNFEQPYYIIGIYFRDYEPEPERDPSLAQLLWCEKNLKTSLQRVMNKKVCFTPYICSRTTILAHKSLLFFFLFLFISYGFFGFIFNFYYLIYQRTLLGNLPSPRGDFRVLVWFIYLHNQDKLN